MGWLSNDNKKALPPQQLCCWCWYLETFETEFFDQKLKSHHLSHLEVGSHHVHHRAWCFSLHCYHVVLLVVFDAPGTIGVGGTASSNLGGQPGLPMLFWRNEGLFLCQNNNNGLKNWNNESHQQNSAKKLQPHTHTSALFNFVFKWTMILENRLCLAKKNISDCPGKAFPLDRTVCIIHKCLP